MIHGDPGAGKETPKLQQPVAHAEELGKLRRRNGVLMKLRRRRWERHTKPYDTSGALTNRYQRICAEQFHVHVDTRPARLHHHRR
jgi:hypothetical protein